MKPGPPLVPLPTGSRSSRSHSREPSLPGSFPPLESAQRKQSEPSLLQAPTPIRPAVAPAFAASSPSSPPNPSTVPPVLGKETSQEDRSSTPTSLPPSVPIPTSLTQNPSARKPIPTMEPTTVEDQMVPNGTRRASLTSSGNEIKAIGVAAGRNLSSSFPAPPGSALPAVPASVIGGAPFPTSDSREERSHSSLAGDVGEKFVGSRKDEDKALRKYEEGRGGVDRSGNVLATVGLGSPLNLSRGLSEERRSPHPLSPGPIGSGTPMTSSSKPPLAGVGIASRQRERTSSTGSQSSTSKDLMLSKLAEALKTERGKSAMYEREILAAEEEIDEIGRNLKVVTQNYKSTLNKQESTIETLRSQIRQVEQELQSAHELDARDAEKYLLLLGVIPSPTLYNVHGLEGSNDLDSTPAFEKSQSSTKHMSASPPTAPASSSNPLFNLFHGTRSRSRSRSSLPPPINPKSVSSDSLATSTVTGNPSPAKSNSNPTPGRRMNFFNKKSSKTQRRIERAANGLSSGFDSSQDNDNSTRPAANPFESLDRDLQILASATANTNETSLPSQQKKVLIKKARPTSYQSQQHDQSFAASSSGPQANLGTANSHIIPRSHSDFERLLVSQRLYAQEEIAGDRIDSDGKQGDTEGKDLGTHEVGGIGRKASSVIDHGVEENRPVGNPRRNSFKTVLGVLFPPHQPSAARRQSLSGVEGTTDSSKIRNWLTDVEQGKKNEKREQLREKEKLFNHLI